MNLPNTKEIYEEGYAIPQVPSDNSVCTYRYLDEFYTIKNGELTKHYPYDHGFHVVKIEELKLKAASGE